MQVTCPHCNRLLKLPDEALGKKLRCGSCKQSFHPGTIAATQPPIESVDWHSQPPSVRNSQRPSRREEEGLQERQGCWNCGCLEPARPIKHVSPTGWAVVTLGMVLAIGTLLLGCCFWPFWIGTFICLPLAALGFLITEEEYRCPDCHKRR